jgi:phosphohistidine phosphatase SixA
VIRLYLVRHAAEKEEDGVRVLTARGRRRFRRAARTFAELEEPVHLICTGRKPHVKETARLLARGLGLGETVELDELSSRASPASLLRAIGLRCSDEDGVVLVGHARQLRRLLASLGLRKRELPLRKGSILRLDVDRLPRPRACVPRFRVRPTASEPEDTFLGVRKAS